MIFAKMTDVKGLDMQNLVICSILFFLISCVAVHSEENIKELPFSKGSRYTLVEFAFYETIDPDQRIKTYNVNTGIGYYMLNNLGLYGILTLSKNEGYFIDNSFDINVGQKKSISMAADSVGLGAGGLLRLHLINIDRFSLFLDASLGGIYYDNEFPPKGTHGNIIWRDGGGVIYQLNVKTALMFGYSFMHISNGKGVVDHNPGNNSQAGFVGLSIKY